MYLHIFNFVCCAYNAYAILHTEIYKHALVNDIDLFINEYLAIVFCFVALAIVNLGAIIYRLFKG